MSSSLDEILSSDNSEYYESSEEMSEKSSSESEGESALFQNKDKTNTLGATRGSVCNVEYREFLFKS